MKTVTIHASHHCTANNRQPVTTICHEEERMRAHRIASFSVVLVLSFLVSICDAVPMDQIGEGSVAGWVPVRADTIRDTSFHAGDTIELPDGDMVYKPYAYQRQEATIPSVNTTVRIVAGDGFATGIVEQVFHNPFDLPFEATYIFPLPHDGAVHGMDFRTRSGVYHAEIKEKEQAKKEYEEAKEEGKQASLLLQSQDNIFVQKLCNIPARDSVTVTIEFSMALSYDMGTFEVAFPTVVGPRFDPAPLPKRAANPRYIPPPNRSGSSLDFSVLLVSPYELSEVECVSHQVNVETAALQGSLGALGIMDSDQRIPDGTTTTLIRLRKQDVLPNKDIVVRYRRANERRDASVQSWHDGEQGYFAMNIYPDLIDTATEGPRAVDMVFVLDISGSMNGAPITKLKQIMYAMLDKARPEDRLSFIAFNNGTSNFHEQPVAATADAIEAARAWITNLNAGGGTYMLHGVQKGLAQPMEPGRVRIMSLITDGYIGDIDAIYREIENDPNGTIAFTFGVGNAVNRGLMDAAATAGEGIATTVMLDDAVTPIVDNFWTRIRTPQIGDIEIDWGGDVDGLTMTTIPDLWLGQPIRIFGRYTTGGSRTITLAGTKDGTAVTESYAVELATDNTLMAGVPRMWAREMIENLMNAQAAAGNEDNKDKILETSLAFDVLCKYTAFLAVADSVVNEEGEMVSSQVPVPVPEGVDGNAAGAGYYDANTPARNVVREIGGTGPGAPSLGLRTTGGLVRLRLTGMNPATTRGWVGIYDVRGRLVYRWNLNRLASSEYRWTWNMTDLQGRRIAPGNYVIVVRTNVLKTARPLALR
jgi:Ca-activated chloride channel family protein